MLEMNNEKIHNVLVTVLVVALFIAVGAIVLFTPGLRQECIKRYSYEYDGVCLDNFCSALVARKTQETRRKIYLPVESYLMFAPNCPKLNEEKK